MAQGDVGIYASQISGHLWAPNGAYDALATVTVPSGGATSITFTGIPSGYKHLQIRALCQTNRTGTPFDDVYYNINGDTTASNYFYHLLIGTGSAVSAATGNNFYGIQVSTPTSGVFTPIIWDILDYSNTTKFKTSRFLNAADTNGGGFVWFGSNLWKNTAAINSISFYSQWGTGWTQNTQFALYGVK